MEIIGFVLPEVHGIRLFIDFALEDFVAVLVVSERFFLLFVADYHGVFFVFIFLAIYWLVIEVICIVFLLVEIFFELDVRHIWIDLYDIVPK